MKSLVIVAVLILSSIACSASVPDTALPEPVNAACGAWQNIDNESTLLLLESEGGVMLTGGRHQVSQITYNGDAIHFRTTYYSMEWQVTITGDRMTALMGDVELHFRRLPETPEILLLNEIDMEPKGELTQETLDSLKQQIETCFTNDISAREESIAFEQKLSDEDWDNPETQKRMRTLNENESIVDQENTEVILSIFDKFGWIDAVRFGKECAEQTFLLVQHTGNLALQISALPYVETAAKNNELSSQNFALLFDRVNLNLLKPQKYGTQVIHDDNNKPVVAPLIDAANVDEFRKSMHLPPLSEYLDRLDKLYGCKIDRSSLQRRSFT